MGIWYDLYIIQADMIGIVYFFLAGVDKEILWTVLLSQHYFYLVNIKPEVYTHCPAADIDN